jgi:hypothetical protein
MMCGVLATSQEPLRVAGEARYRTASESFHFVMIC